MFESIMWKYMNEEGELLMKLIKDRKIREQLASLKDMKALYFVAHGSSYNASASIAPFISRLSKVRTYVYTPSNFRYNCPSIDEENKKTTYVLGISQTGTSRGVLEALEEAKKKGFKVIGITAVSGSPLDELSDLTLDLRCGEEDSNAKTKGYSSTLTLLMMLGIELSQGVNKEDYYRELEEEVTKLDEVRKRTVRWCKENDYGKNMDNLYVIGSGMNFASAMEGQLKVMETMCIPTMFNDIEEFSHGMHRSLNRGSYVLLLNAGSEKELMEKTRRYLEEKKIDVLELNGEEETDEKNVIYVGKYEKSASLLSIVTAIQAISAFVPENNGLDPNRNANNDYTDFVETRV
ncbi:MAG: SIS domain-containing protein [Erysipelotrichaceae bacterium]|nr:SIS domain-containing protein [Erysipelotrichaceae bacterium]